MHVDSLHVADGGLSVPARGDFEPASASAGRECRALLFLAVFMLTVCGITSEAHARRGVAFVIVLGFGEKVTEMGALPPDVSRAVAEELRTEVTVAFLHERIHVFWLDLWTWNGRHVLHSGDKYWEPNSTWWQNMIGEEPSAKYGKPIFYRIPSAPTLLIVVIVGYAVRKALFKTKQEKLDALRQQEKLDALRQSPFRRASDV